MPPHLLARLGLVAGVLIALFIAQAVYLAVVLAWADRQTLGLAYYGATPEARLRFRRRLRLHARILAPIIWFQSRISRLTFKQMSFEAEDLAGPRGTCSPESFSFGRAYLPAPEDIFVATQMKCGTTWMLHLVYQVLRRGEGDLVERGSTLHAVCPWLEGRRTVSMGEAPLVSEARPSRIIKTHFPASHIPWNDQARYIYVARHPVSCFASVADFIRENAGPFTPPIEAIEQWFTRDTAMWWGGWPTHVAGWWHQSTERNNVLFVTYEEMTRDLPSVARRVAEFLGVPPLNDLEAALVIEKSSFRYMQGHQEAFEMHPPQILGTDVRYFVRGDAARHRDVPPDRKRRIAEWCEQQLRRDRFPLERFYPDVAG